jgi:hypothetical protein
MVYKYKKMIEKFFKTAKYHLSLRDRAYICNGSYQSVCFS